MKLTFGIKNILKFIVAIIIIVFGLYMIYVTIFESPEIDSLLNLIIALVFFVIIIYFSLRYAISQIISKRFKVMEAVKDYISFSELKEVVKEEIFIPVNLPGSIKKTLPKSDIKAFEKNLLVSKNWVYAYNVMIPKKMIVSVEATFFRQRDIFSFNLVNKSSYRFANVIRESDKSTKNLIKYFSLNKDLSNIKDIPDPNEYIEKFEREVHTKEEFLKYIQNI